MAVYIGRRLLQVVPMLLLISLVVFLMIQAAPYDVIDSITTPNMSAETIEIIRQRYGVDDPVLVQYVRWLGNVLQGDLGYSLVSQYSISADLAAKIPNTVLLVVPAYLTALVLAIWLGLWAGANHGRRIDRFIDGISAIGLATPPFWFALLLIYLFGYYLNWFPIIGMRTVGSDDPLDLLRHFVMPYLVLTVAFAPDLIRYVRSSTVSQLREDYVLVQRAFGATRAEIFRNHVSRNVLLPIVTQLGIALPLLVTGAIITETIFGWPGVGPLLPDRHQEPRLSGHPGGTAALGHPGDRGQPDRRPALRPGRSAGTPGAEPLVTVPLTTAVPRDRRLREALSGSPAGWFAVVFLTVVIVVSLLAPLLPLDPETTDLDAMSAPPSWEHWFGTDQIGRDYFARVIFGGRISLLVGFLAMVTATAIGALVGLVAGFSHPRVDNLLMRLVDFLSSIPWMILVIVVSVFLKPGLVTIIIVIGGFTWMTTARLVRAETLSVKERAYVGYSGYIGERAPRIVGRHILPDVVPTILVAATASVSNAMMTEASLSFLGVGVQQPMASWGSLLQTAQGSLQQLPHLALIPGLLIMGTVFSFNALGNTLRRYLSRGA